MGVVYGHLIERVVSWLSEWEKFEVESGTWRVTVDLQVLSSGAVGVLYRGKHLGYVLTDARGYEACPSNPRFSERVCPTRNWALCYLLDRARVEPDEIVEGESTVG